MANIFLTAAISILESAGTEEVLKAMQNWHDKKPGIIDRIVQESYPVIDVEIENYVKETKSKVDDRVVKDLKELCETFAENNDLELQNLDKD